MQRYFIDQNGLLSFEKLKYTAFEIKSVEIISQQLIILMTRDLI